jgi:hypothetical protein
MVGSESQPHGKGRTLPRRAFGGDRTAVNLYKLLHQGETDAAALESAPLRPFDTMEAFE